MKTTIRVTWTGYRAFTPANVARHVPEAPGVYRLARAGPDGKLVPFYVGEAVNLRAQLAGHLSAWEPNPGLRRRVRQAGCMFTMAKVPRRNERDAIVRYLYYFYEPACNDPASVPDAPDVAVNSR